MATHKDLALAVAAAEAARVLAHAALESASLTHGDLKAGG